jgi:hypothetical protein
MNNIMTRMINRSITYVNPAKPMGRKEARKKFRRIVDNLDRIHAQQMARKRVNPHDKIRGNVTAYVVLECASRKRPNAISQTLFVYDPSKKSRAKMAEIPGRVYSEQTDTIKYTDCFSRELPRGWEKVKSMISGVVDVMGTVVMRAGLGGVAGIGLVLLSKVIGPDLSGVSMQMAAILGASASTILGVAKDCIAMASGVRTAFDRELMRFIRKPENRDAVEQIQSI